MLTPRWYPLLPHSGQTAYFNSPHRFNVLPAGRRSGKTECAKRKLVIRAIKGSEFIRPKFFAAAPTFGQAKIIYWDDLKSLVPSYLIAKISETQLSIVLTTGTEIRVVGMDKPQRIEGTPWDGGILDEFANMKEDAWQANVMPALADRAGWCDLIGVPEGRNHYYGIYNRAKADMAEFGSASNWGAFTWKSSTVLEMTEKGRAHLVEARRSSSKRMFEQEYEADFSNSGGVVIYAFSQEANVRRCEYNPKLPMHVGMDFNVNPMTATMWQEIGGASVEARDLGIKPLSASETISVQVGEVVIGTSDTVEMSQEIIRRYGKEGGPNKHITIYPDPAGAQRRTSAQGKTDISILCEPQFDFNVKAMSSHPMVRDRNNITNSRFKNANGEIRAYVDPSCEVSIAALERLTYKEGTSDPDKSSGFDHPVDATGYYMFTRFDKRQEIKFLNLPHMQR
jgi:hypothetical protein